MPDGTAKFNVIIHENVEGSVQKEPTWSNSSNDDEEKNSEHVGKIIYKLKDVTFEIDIFPEDCPDLRLFPRFGDKVTFDISMSRATKDTKAVNVCIVERRNPSPAPTPKKEKKQQQQQQQPHEEQLGFVAAMKDGFGFLETAAHDKEIFFHFSNFNGNPDKLDVGSEVRYTVIHGKGSGTGGSKTSAENVVLVEKGTIPQHEAHEEIFLGKVVRPLRSVNPDQNDYCGLIQAKDDDGTVVGSYAFGIASLKNKKDLLQVGDPVQFQASKREPNFAVNVKSTKEKQRAFVEAMKGQFGFLSFEVEEGKKLFFHTTEVEHNDVLQQGDEVEFVLVTNKRSGKHSACCVRKISTSKRPERLISKLKTMNLEDANRLGRKIVVIRQPKGPESGAQGFKARRNVTAVK